MPYPFAAESAAHAYKESRSMCRSGSWRALLVRTHSGGPIANAPAPALNRWGRGLRRPERARMPTKAS